MADTFPALQLNIRRSTYDNRSYTQTVRSVLSIWIDNALAFIQTAAAQQAARQEPVKKGPIDKNLPLKIGPYLHKLHQSSGDQLADVAASLLMEARNAGIEGLEGEPAFISAV